MRLLAIALLVITSSLGVHAQSFPKGWIGEWEGELEIYNASGLQQKVVMGLNILTKSDSTWAWQIIYGEGAQRQLRDYELKVGQDSQYILDEKNTIKLYLSYINNTFESLFQVSGSQLLVSYEMRGGNIIFRTVSSADKAPMNTGGRNGVPEVVAKKVTTTQIAVLTKK